MRRWSVTRAAVRMAAVAAGVAAVAACEPGAQSPAPVASAATTGAKASAPGASASGTAVAYLPEAHTEFVASVEAGAPGAAASASASATAASAAPAVASAAPAPSATAPAGPLPAVKVANIGIHIGGGPYDDETKAPIAKSVAPHLDAMRACWTQVDDPARGGDFGVDLLVPPEGGRAKVSNPRTSLRPPAFRDCIVHVFEQVDFQKPRRGLTMASYSLRFTP